MEQPQDPTECLFDAIMNHKKPLPEWMTRKPSKFYADTEEEALLDLIKFHRYNTGQEQLPLPTQEELERQVADFYSKRAPYASPAAPQKQIVSSPMHKPCTSIDSLQTQPMSEMELDSQKVSGTIGNEGAISLYQVQVPVAFMGPPYFPVKTSQEEDVDDLIALMEQTHITAESKLPSKRSIMIAQAKAAKNGPIVSKQTQSELRSARLKTSKQHYKSIGQVKHESRLERKRREMMEEKEKKDAEEKAQWEAHLKGIDAQTMAVRWHTQQEIPLGHIQLQLLNLLTPTAIKDLPDNFSKMSELEKVQTLFLAAETVKEEQERKDEVQMQEMEHGAVLEELNLDEIGQDIHEEWPESGVPANFQEEEEKTDD